MQPVNIGAKLDFWRIFENFGFAVFCPLMALFFNRNSDPVHLNTPYSHNSGPIVPKIKSTGAQ